MVFRATRCLVCHEALENEWYIVRKQGCSHEIWSGTVAVGGDAAEGSGLEVEKKNFFHLHYSVIRMGSHDTFALSILHVGSVAFKLLISSSVNCGCVAANWSAGRATEFVNIGRNVVVASEVVRLKLGQLYRWLWPWNVCCVWDFRKFAVLRFWESFILAYVACLHYPYI